MPMRKAFWHSEALSFNCDAVMPLVLDPRVFSPAWFRRDGLGDAPLRDPLRIRALSGRCPGEGAVEPIYIDLSLASLRFEGGVHRREQFRA
jgi:hypothetical protein